MAASNGDGKTPKPKTKEWPIPSLPLKFVTRNGLLNRLEEALDYKVVLLAAPVGFGKTMLLREWCHQAEDVGAAFPDIVWIELNKLDNNLTRFVSKVEQAIRLTSLPLAPHFTQLEIVEHLADLLVTRRTGVRAQQTVFVIDNYNSLVNQQAKDILHTLISTTPSTVHFVVATNVMNQLDFIVYKATGNLFMFTENDLAFTLEETIRLNEALSNKVMENGGKPHDNGSVNKNDSSVLGMQKDIETIHERTEGWPMGTWLALRQMKCIGAPAERFKCDGSIRDIDNIFSHIVETSLSKEYTHFLLVTSIFECFDVSLCDFVLGISESKNIIEYLEDNMIFIVSLDTGKHHYRYNHIFLDWLRNKLHDTCSDNQIRDFHSRACEWFANHERYCDAARHAIEASDIDTILQLVDTTIVPQFIGDKKDLLEWVETISADNYLKTPLICLLAAWAYVHQGRPNIALRWLRHLKDSLHGPKDFTREERENLSFSMRFVEAYCRLLGNNYERSINESLNLLQNHFYGTGNATEGLLKHMLAESYERCGNLDLATEYYMESLHIGRMKNLIQTEMYAAYELGHIQYLRGQLSEALETCGRAFDKCPSDLMIHSALLSLIARVQLELMDVKEASLNIERASAGMSKERNIDLLLDVSVVKVELLMMENKLVEASHAISETLVIADKYAVPRQAIITALLVAGELEVRRNNSVEVKNLLTRVEKRIDDNDLINQIKLGMLRASLASMQNNPQLALDHLSDTMELLRRTDLKTLLLYALINSVVLMMRTAATSQAMMQLGEALDLGIHEVYIKAFLEGGSVIKNLLYEMQSSTRAGKSRRMYIQKILQGFHDQNALRQSVNSWEQDDLIYERKGLTKREFEILKMLNYGMTRQEISKSANISLNTVKTHITSIYAKLDVHNSVELFDVADSLNLL
jgi:LuxR family maltose regulon positive regulatory protein